MPSAPVVSPSDEALADLQLAADGLLSDHLAGDPVSSTTAGHRISLRVTDEVAQAALAADEVLIADAESVPVVRLIGLSRDDGILTGRAERAQAPTGIGHQLRLTSPMPRGATAVVLARPPMTEDIDRLAAAAAQGAVVLVTGIASPSPDGVPVAGMLRLAQHARTRLISAGVDAHVVTATLHWRGYDSDRNLAVAVATALGASKDQPVFLPDAGADPSTQWGQVLSALHHGTTDDLDAATTDPVVSAELQRWRPPRDRRGFALFFTGLSGAGKSTIARAVRDELLERGERTITTLDGDEVRRLLSAGLGFGAEGRDQNVRRIGYVAAEVTRHGGVAICAPIAPYERSRAAARGLVEQAGGDFILVHVATSLQDCEARDVKGLYARARSGEIAEFTGVSDPYEPPEHPELRVQTSGRTVDECAAEVLTYLHAGGWLGTVTSMGGAHG